MDRRRRKKAKTSSSCSEEVSSIEWEFINMSEQEEDLIYRMHKLVGDRMFASNYTAVHGQILATYRTGVNNHFKTAFNNAVGFDSRSNPGTQGRGNREVLVNETR